MMMKYLEKNLISLMMKFITHKMKKVLIDINMKQMHIVKLSSKMDFNKAKEKIYLKTIYSKEII